MSAIEIDVALGDRRYPIRIGGGLLDDATRWRDALRGRHVLIVSDENVAPLYLARIVAGLDGFEHDALVLPAGEGSKTLDHAARAFDALARLGATR